MEKHITILIFSLFLLSFSGNAQDSIKVSKSEIDIVQENYERNLDSVIHSYFFKKISKSSQSSTNSREKDSLFSRNISQISDSVFIMRLGRIPTTFPLQYNARVRNLIEYYLKVTRAKGNIYFALSNYYNPIFEEILDAKGIPLEFKYLPIVESALNPNAVSRAGAVGLWQFMYATGKMYNLKINSLVDERRDPVKSSEAAANYLADLYKIFDDWTLALAAYNCGPGNVNKAIKRAGGGPQNFWTIYEFLPRETRGYVPAFIAINYVMYYYKDHGIIPAGSFKPILTDTVLVTENIHFKQIAGMMPEVSLEQLREFNPQYKNDIVPGRVEPSVLRLPIAGISPFIAYYDSIVNFDADSYFKPVDIRALQPYDIVYHVVKKGDTWSGIAAKYRVTIADVKRWNNTNSKYPQLGKRYTIHQKNSLYANTPTQVKETAVKATPTPTRTGKHTVKKGESLYAIASKYNVKVDEIKALNNLQSNMIKPGQVLKIHQQ